MRRKDEAWLWHEMAVRKRRRGGHERWRKHHCDIDVARFGDGEAVVGGRSIKEAMCSRLEMNLNYRNQRNSKCGRR